MCHAMSSKYAFSLRLSVSGAAACAKFEHSSQKSAKGLVTELADRQAITFRIF